jgi:hypothetical protein
LPVGWWADVYAAAGGGGRRGAVRRSSCRPTRPGSTTRSTARALIGVGGAATAAAGRWRKRVAGATPARWRRRGRRRRAGGALTPAPRHWRRRARDRRDPRRRRSRTTVTGELAARGRLHLADLDRALAGSFVELDAGLGLQAVAYRAGDADLAGVLISRFAGGVFLPCARGEVAVFYDHRRDTLAGGLPAGRAAGFFGSVGATAEVAITPTWIATAAVEFGSARLATLGVRRGLR